MIARVRLDVWLWRIRLFKTRSAAVRSIAEGAVRLTREGRTTSARKPSLLVGAGDALTVAVAGRVFSLEFLAAGVRRGPAAEARTLYRLRVDGVESGEALDEEAIAASSQPHS